MSNWNRFTWQKVPSSARAQVVKRVVFLIVSVTFWKHPRNGSRHSSTQTTSSTGWNMAIVSDNAWGSWVGVVELVRFRRFCDKCRYSLIASEQCLGMVMPWLRHWELNWRVVSGLAIDNARITRKGITAFMLSLQCAVVLARRTAHELLNHFV